jgi:hypothetical protein
MDCQVCGAEAEYNVKGAKVKHICDDCAEVMLDKKELKESQLMCI